MTIVEKAIMVLNIPRLCEVTVATDSDGKIHTHVEGIGDANVVSEDPEIQGYLRQQIEQKKEALSIVQINGRTERVWGDATD